MLTIAQLLAELHNDGIELGVANGQIQYRARKGKLDALRLAQIRQRREEIIGHLAAQPAIAAASPPLVARDLGGLLPLSFTQQTFVDLYEKLREPRLLHPFVVKRIGGALDAQLVEETFRAITRRHAILRAHYVNLSGCGPALVIDDAAPAFFSAVDLSHLPTEERDERARRCIRSATDARFNLSTGPLLRVSLVKLAATDHVLIVVLHHSVADGWSVGVLLREFGELCAAARSGRAPDLASLTVQFTDHTAWLDAWTRGEAGKAHLQYWIETLRGIVDPFLLPCDQDAPTRQAPAERPRVMHLSGQTLATLRAIAQREGVTLAMLAVTAIFTALARWTRRHDLLLAILHPARSHREIENLIGCFVDAWVLRLDVLQAASFGGLLRLVRSAWINALPHRQIPFRMVKEHLAAGQPLHHSQVNYLTDDLTNAASAAAHASGGAGANDAFTLQELKWPVEADPALESVAGINLSFTFREMPASLSWSVEYAAEFFAAETIARLAEAVRDCLVALAMNPQRMLEDTAVFTADGFTRSPDGSPPARSAVRDNFSKEL